MMRNRTIVEWQVLQDDSEWNSHRHPQLPLSGAVPEPSVAVSAHDRRLLWGAVGLLFLAVISAGYLLWRTAQAGLNRVEQEIGEVVVLETWMQAADEGAGQVDGTTISQLPSLPPSVDLVDLQEDVALVQVEVPGRPGESASSQLRCYRETAWGWAPAPPESALWGQRLRLESTYFTFDFQQLDGPAVAEAAPRLDAVYARIAANLGLPLSPRTDRLTIRLDPAVTPAIAPNAELTGGVLTVASPSRFLRPADVTAATVLVQAVTPALVNRMVDRTTPSTPLDWNDHLHKGLRLWLLWDLEQPLAVGTPAVARWLYADFLASGRGVVTGLPDNAGLLCETAQRWQLQPFEIGIPLGCRPAPTAILVGLVSVHLDTMSVLEPEPQWAAANQLWGPCLYPLRASLMAATLFDYVAAEHGENAVPRLLAALPEYDSWDALIPAVFGVSVAEFERGWQAHVAGY